MENCSSHYRVVKNVENLSSVYSNRQSYANVDANCESGLHWKLNVFSENIHHKADTEQQRSKYISWCPSPWLLLAVLFTSVEYRACMRWCRSGNIHPAPEDDRTWPQLALSHLSSLFGSLESCHWCWSGIKWTVCLADAGWLVLLHCSFNNSYQYIARIIE